jgi:hypothetical protein
MTKREAQFGSLFRHWLKTVSIGSAAFELKQTQTNALPFSALQEHQIDALRSARSPYGILYKAPDDSAGVKPFDYFYLQSVPAFVVIRYPKSFHVIPVENFVAESESSKRRSLTSERAEEISTYSVPL